MARLEDGSWSAPASISPVSLLVSMRFILEADNLAGQNNLSAGFMLGCDVYDAVLSTRSSVAAKIPS